MGADNGVAEIVKGAALAASELNTDLILVGNEEEIRTAFTENRLSDERIEIVHADSVITMEDPALSVVRDKKDSSMNVGLHLLAEGKGDAFVSAGNTGALLAGSTFIVRRIKGIRAAIAATLPLSQPTLLVDAGANIAVTPEILAQFAMMGSIYMQSIFNIREPRVGLVNNGAESTKGTPLYKDTYALLEKSDLNFVGNIEGRDIPFGVCDVLVTDGFTGNIILKYTEGFGKFFMGTMKDLFTQNVLTTLSGAMIKGKVKDLKKRFDASEYGGAPLLGLSKPVIKAHGSSDANAVKNAVRQAIYYVNTGIILEIARKSESLVINTPPEKEN